MPLAAGERLGPYRVVAQIGAGGMGEVYRARDTKLDRDVAIKVLPAALARDPERLSRFEREAKVLAALNHPNIAAIYGLEETESHARAIVMELVEGPTLAERIGSGPISLEESLKIAAQIADALEAAHDKGIVHRDLKPANVKAPSEGTVKVLDLGLATALPGTDREGSESSNSPTLTMGSTEAGVILGTAAYMSPEQASGRRVDRRADIWSFGVVLWEMLAGKRLFKGGETVSHTLADVLRADIDFTKLPTATPAPVRDLIKRCLDRDAKTRLRDIGEARVVIQRWLSNPVEPSPAAVSTATKGGGSLPWIAATVIAAGALAALAFVHFRETPPQEHTLRYTVALPEGSILQSSAISPDGRYVVIAAALDGKRQLWLRPLDALQSQPMPTTEGATYPFWSPDSRYIGFFAQGKLRKIKASGGPSQAVCDAVDGRGGSWSIGDVIVFSPAPIETAIQRVPAAGGVPADATKTKGVFRFPKFLPDGRHFLYLVTRMEPEKNGVYLGSLDGGEDRRVLADESSFSITASAAGSGPGHLLFIRENTLMAQPFDSGKAQVSGEVFPITEGVSFTNVNNFAPVSVSENGVLLYWTGGNANTFLSNQIVWYDRAGKLIEPVGMPGNILTPSISPDEKSIAFARLTGTANRDIWLRDLVRGNERRLTTDPSSNISPVWSPKNGDRIVFRSTRAARLGDLYMRPSNGSGQDQLIFSDSTNKFAYQWSRDGRFIVYADYSPKTKEDLWYLPLGDAGGDSGAPSGKPADRKPVPVQFLHSDFNEIEGQLSPDGRWMAYSSDVSGQYEVYVQPFPAADSEVRISTAGGQQPRWRADGKELFYLAADGKMTAVAVTVSVGPKSGFTAGAPVALFDAHAIASTNPIFSYDVTGDGKRFLVVANGATASSAAPAQPPLTVQVNWNAGVRK